MAGPRSQQFAGMSWARAQSAEPYFPTLSSRDLKTMLQSMYLLNGSVTQLSPVDILILIITEREAAFKISGPGKYRTPFYG